MQFLYYLCSTISKRMAQAEHNRAIDILKIIAIILVVMGHMGFIPRLGGAFEPYFPIYSYHILLFLFCSGYLFRDFDWRDLGRFVWRKTRSLALPLIGWNIVYAGIVSLINLRHPVTYFPATEQIWTLQNLFVEPFVSGHQYLLNLATWFVGMLYLTLLVYGLLHLITKRIPDWVMLIVFLALAALGLYSTSLPLPGRWWLVAQRIALALFFVHFGRCFRKYIEPRLRYQHLWWMLIVIAGVTYFAHCMNGNHRYIMAWMNYDHCIVMPIVAGILGCLFWMLMSMQITHLVPANRVETLLAKSTWSIMTNHLLVRFMFCWTVVHFSQNMVAREMFTTNFWYFPQDCIWFYHLGLFLEIALPCLWQLFADYIRNRLYESASIFHSV